jgi:hypothetical protein
MSRATQSFPLSRSHLETWRGDIRQPGAAGPGYLATTIFCENSDPILCTFGMATYNTRENVD